MRARPVRLAPRSKYGAQPTISHGIRFHSKAEARRYHELLLLARAGEITHLELQPKFELWAAKPLNNRWEYGCREVALVGCYVADFQYRDQRTGGYTVVEDVKGLATPLYKLKKKLAEACHGITIMEIRR